MSAKTYAVQIAGPAINACINSGIFPSVVIAQAMLEGNSGTSALAINFNNPFGHTAGTSWSGQTGKLVPNGTLWRKYNDISQAIAEHIKILKKPKYWLRGIGQAKTPFDQVQIIQDAGFNAGPDKKQYAAQLSAIIRQYNLQQYDAQLFAAEKQRNTNSLAFKDQGALTKFLHSITG